MRVSRNRYRGDVTIGVCPGSSSSGSEAGDRDVRAGLLFGRRPQEAEEKEQGGYVMEGRRPVKGMSLGCESLSLCASGTPRNCPSRAHEPGH